MLERLRDNFTAPAAAVAFGGMAAFAAVSGPAYAEGPSGAQSASGYTTASMDEVNERVAVGLKASEYAEQHPGQIGFAILEGADTRGEVTGGRMKQLLEGGFKNKYSLGSEGYVGDNGNKATEITFSYAFYNTSTQSMDVMVRGPYNFGDAIPAAQEVATAVQAQRLFYASSYDPD